MRRLLLLAPAIVSAFAVRTANAARPGLVETTVDPSKRTISAIVLTPPGDYAADAFHLTVDPAEAQSTATTATHAERYGAGSSDAVTLVIVLQASRALLGDCATGGGNVTPPARDALAALSNMYPGKLDVGLVTFDERVTSTSVTPATEFQRMEPLGNGGQCRADGRDVSGGLNRAIEMLRGHSGHQVLVLITDDTIHPDSRDAAMIAGAQIDAFTLALTSASGGNHLGQLYIAEHADELASKATQITAAAQDVYRVEFHDDALPFDGHDHDVRVTVGNNPTHADERISFPKRSSSRLPWLFIGAGVAVAIVLVVLIVLAVRGRRAQPQPVPPKKTPSVPKQTERLPHQTRPLEPRKTIALSKWDGPPGVAGWFVTLNGSTPYETFVLDRTGETTIGASDNCGICLEDRAISNTHCKVIGKAGYFTIVDLKSANGTYVDGAQITEPKTLRSGMSVRLGQTELVFKGVSPEAAGSS